MMKAQITPWRGNAIASNKYPTSVKQTDFVFDNSPYCYCLLPIYIALPTISCLPRPLCNPRVCSQWVDGKQIISAQSGEEGGF